MTSCWNCDQIMPGTNSETSASTKNAVKISYRWSTGAALLSIAMSILTGIFFHRSPESTVASTVGWDPCMMWEQMAVTVRLSALLCFGSFLVLIVQGLRNRSVPRLLSVVGLISFGVVTQHALWREMRCDTQPGQVAFFIWIAAAVLMCLHQIVQHQKCNTT
jgi:hypothetical protein